MVVQKLLRIQQCPEDVLQRRGTLVLPGAHLLKRYVQLIWARPAAQRCQVQLIDDVQVASARIDEGVHAPVAGLQLSVQVRTVDQVKRLREVRPHVAIAGAKDLPFWPAEY